MCGVLWQEEAWGAEGSAGEERRGQGATVASEASGCVPRPPTSKACGFPPSVPPQIPSMGPFLDSVSK